MKKLFLILAILSLAIGNAYPAVGWSKAKPAGSVSPSSWDDAVRENNDATDLMLSTYNNVKVTYATAATLTVSAGGVMVSNSAGSTRLMLANTSATTVTWSNLDTGSEAAETIYYVYAIGSAVTDTTFTVKISTSSTAPSGVTYYKKLGSFYNNASKNIETIIDDDYPSGFGYWQDKCFNTEYTANTDGFVIGNICYGRLRDGEYISFSAQTPIGTERQYGCFKVIEYDDDGVSIPIMLPVKKGNTWEITTAGKTLTTGSNLYWLPSSN